MAVHQREASTDRSKRLAVGLVFFAVSACQQSAEGPAEAGGPATSPAGSPAQGAALPISADGLPLFEAGSDGAGGITWKVPEGWVRQPGRPLRVATYTLPKPAGASEDGECAIFHFGPGRGGHVENAISRWLTEIQDPKGRPLEEQVHRVELEADGIRITTIEVSGTYQWSPSVMSTKTVPKPNYRFLGAVAQTPDGNVFFKLVAPAVVADHWDEAFDEMLRSVRRITPGQ